MTFQEIILTLQKFWGDKGCIISNPYDIETGAGTFNPDTFLCNYMFFLFYEAKGNSRHPLCKPGLSKHFFEMKLKLAF